MTLAGVADKEGKCRHSVPYLEHNGNCIVCCPSLDDQNAGPELRALMERLEAFLEEVQNPGFLFIRSEVARRLREVMGR